MCEEDITAKNVIKGKNNEIETFTEWADNLYHFYKTSQALTPYYARHKNEAKFYMLDFSINNENCEEIPYKEYLQMDFESRLISITAEYVNETLLKAFYVYTNLKENPNFK